MISISGLRLKRQLLLLPKILFYKQIFVQNMYARDEIFGEKIFLINWFVANLVAV